MANNNQINVLSDPEGVDINNSSRGIQKHSSLAANHSGTTTSRGPSTASSGVASSSAYPRVSISLGAQTKKKRQTELRLKRVPREDPAVRTRGELNTNTRSSTSTSNRNGEDHGSSSEGKRVDIGGETAINNIERKKKWKREPLLTTRYAVCVGTAYICFFIALGYIWQAYSQGIHEIKIPYRQAPGCGGTSSTGNEDLIGSPLGKLSGPVRLESYKCTLVSAASQDGTQGPTSVEVFVLTLLEDVWGSKFLYTEMTKYNLQNLL